MGIKRRDWIIIVAVVIFVLAFPLIYVTGKYLIVDKYSQSYEITVKNKHDVTCWYGDCGTCLEKNTYCVFPPEEWGYEDCWARNTECLEYDWNFVKCKDEEKWFYKNCFGWRGLDERNLRLRPVVIDSYSVGDLKKMDKPPLLDYIKNFFSQKLLSLGPIAKETLSLKAVTKCDGELVNNYSSEFTIDEGQKKTFSILVEDMAGKTCNTEFWLESDNWRTGREVSNKRETIKVRLPGVFDE